MTQIVNTGKKHLNLYNIFPCKINFTVLREVRFSSQDNSFLLLIHAFQLATVINTLHTIPTMILIVEVVRDIITVNSF